MTMEKRLAGLAQLIDLTVPEGLSEDLSSLMFSLNGVLYTLPLPFSEFQENGWEICESMIEAFGAETVEMDMPLEPGESKTLTLVNGGQRVIVTFSNPGRRARPLAEGIIIEVVVQDTWRGQTPSLILPGNIRISSTYDEIIAAHGELTRRSGGWLYYTTDEFNIAFILVYGDRDVVNGLWMRAFL